MKSSIEIELKSFNVPNYVIVDNDLEARREGIENPKFALSQLSPETLDRLCNEFRREVFKKAGKNEPPQVAPECPRCSKVRAVT